MAALAADRNTPRRGARQFGYPLAAGAKLYAGALACINAAGYLVAGSTSNALKCVGVAERAADNTGGAAGAVTGEVERGCFRFANSASTDLIALSDVGNDCYIVDDQTVAKTSNAGARSVAGKIRDVDAGGVWVEI